MTANVFPFILFPVQKILIPRNAIRSSRAFGTEHLSFVPARAPDDGIVEMKGLEQSKGLVLRGDNFSSNF